MCNRFVWYVLWNGNSFFLLQLDWLLSGNVIGFLLLPMWLAAALDISKKIVVLLVRYVSLIYENKLVFTVPLPSMQFVFRSVGKIAVCTPDFVLFSKHWLWHVGAFLYCKFLHWCYTQYIICRSYSYLTILYQSIPLNLFVRLKLIRSIRFLW